MEGIIILLLALLCFGIIGVIFLLMRKKDRAGGLMDEKMIAMMERLNMLNDQNKDMRRALDDKLAETHRVTQSQFRSTQDQLGQTMRTAQAMANHSAKLISDVTEKLTKLDETNKQVINFSAQLQSLQDILKNPKQRGVLGEYFLEETLKNVLPPNSYEMQYKFKDGSIVDAVVFVGDKIIPVDSKFSLENYERILNCSDPAEKEKLEKLFKQDLKDRIDETSKYVKPGEKTLDFAFMFIPSEAIFYDLLVNKVGAIKINTRDLIEYAFCDKKVIIVSPTSFLAYLQTVLQGLRALQIEESAKTIRHNVEKLSRHILSYEEFMKKLGASMKVTVSHYNSAYREFGKIDKDVAKIIEGKPRAQVVQIEKPKDE
ncbi:MAG: DNA recombination protein RmuC [Patescibacteria group bacterium]|jgi:DNA recombination protein RmuC